MEKSSSVCRRLRTLFTVKPPPKPHLKHPPQLPEPQLHHPPGLTTAVAPPSNTPETAAAPSPTTPETAAAPPSKTPGKYEILVDRFKKNSRYGGFRRKRSAYKATVLQLAQAGQFSHIEDILQHQKQYPDISDEHFTARLIILYGRAKMLDRALQLFDEMPDLNCPRTIISLNALLAACLSSENFDKVIELFQELPTKLSIEPDVISYTSAIKAFCKKGLFDNAFSMLEEMKVKGIAPEAMTFEVLLIECYCGGRLLEWENTWRLMKEKEVKPVLRCYNSRIHGLVEENRFSEAVETVKELEQKGLEGDGYTYHLLIKGFTREGNVEEVKKWYAALRESKAAANIFTFVALVHFALERVDIDFAYQLCKDCVGVKGKLSSTMVGKVIDGLVKESKLEEAKELRQLHKLVAPKEEELAASILE